MPAHRQEGPLLEAAAWLEQASRKSVQVSSEELAAAMNLTESVEADALEAGAWLEAYLSRHSLVRVGVRPVDASCCT